MANQALNQVPEVQNSELANVDYFLSVMKNGDIKKMSKEDMASVCGRTTIGKSVLHRNAAHEKRLQKSK